MDEKMQEVGYFKKGSYWFLFSLLLVCAAA